MEPKPALCVSPFTVERGLGPMPKGEEYREFAAECLRVAHQLKDQTEKAKLIRMAQIWQELAEKSDALNKNGAH
jgi:hypothetical protein